MQKKTRAPNPELVVKKLVKIKWPQYDNAKTNDLKDLRSDEIAYENETRRIHLAICE